MRQLLFAAVLLLCAFACAGAEFGDSRVTRPILQAVVTGQPPLSRQMHEDFWREIRKGPRMSLAQLRSVMLGALDLNMEYQREVWQSALQSYRLKRVTRSPTLTSLDAGYLQRVQSLMDLDGEGKTTLAQRFAAMREDADHLLSSAAKGAPYSLRDGSRGVVDEATVAAAIQNLDSLRARIDRLLDPVWKQNG
jgi:hypothetical protein